MRKTEQAIQLVLKDKDLDWCDKCSLLIPKKDYSSHLSSESHIKCNCICHSDNLTLSFVHDKKCCSEMTKLIYKKDTDTEYIFIVD